jgi:hypothetical protein
MSGSPFAAAASSAGFALLTNSVKRRQVEMVATRLTGALIPAPLFLQVYS